MTLTTPITINKNNGIQTIYTQLAGDYDYSNIDRYVAITLNQNGQRIVLAAGDAYDILGQWTDSQLDVLLQTWVNNNPNSLI